MAPTGLTALNSSLWRTVFPVVGLLGLVLLVRRLDAGLPQRLLKPSITLTRVGGDKAKSVGQEDRSTPPLQSSSDAHIISILENAAKSSKRMTLYSSGNLQDVTIISYEKLYETVQTNARRLQALPGWQRGRRCLILVDDHHGNILWFWSVVLSGGIPVMCPPYAHQDLKTNLQHLSALLSNPICLTSKDRLNDALDDLKILQTYDVEDLQMRPIPVSSIKMPTDAESTSSDTAAIMLTSGSSGNSKAVPLSHRQIFSCLKGKSEVFPNGPDGTTLNWIGMDHVAGLVEAHLRALWAGDNQIHVEAQDVTSSPTMFLELLSRHKVSASFAPHFMLARIVDEYDGTRLREVQSLDLSHLRIITSGGEASSTDTVLRFSNILQRYGAPENVVVPGFGMTETGAGCIYNRSGPQSDLRKGYEFVSLGKCVSGVEMRITSLTRDGSQVEDLVVGNLELRGPTTFTGYINNDKANEESFTSDGWFRTGDMGFIDLDGHLVLTGRSKDVICINGVKHLPVDQERIIEDAKIPGVEPDHIVCFAWRPVGAHTEQCCVVYQHSFDRTDAVARVRAEKSIVKAVLMSTGARPHVLPLPPGVLQKSTLGKLSRAKIRTAFAKGAFAAEDAFNRETIRHAADVAVVKPADKVEEDLLNIIANVVQQDLAGFGVETDYLDVGMTSVDLFRLRSRICRHFGLANLGIEILIKHNTARSLRRAIAALSSDSEKSHYDPVVPLKPDGSRTPLWLIHPGVGEVLVFIGLAHYIQDRPVFALRARGFEEGDDVFGSIDEVVTTYVEAIKSRQPHGPYAIAGYSYGSMLAFEISKRLEALGDAVPFLGSFNLPPHIKQRMRQLSLAKCLIHLSMFLGIVSDTQCDELELDAKGSTFETILEKVFLRCDQARVRKLDLTRSVLSRWTRVAFALQSMASDYEPSGSVQSMNVFYCEPLKAVAKSKQEWLENQLSRWKEFCRNPPRFHAVGGAHYTMLSTAHVRSFQKVLNNAMAERDV